MPFRTLNIYLVIIIILGFHTMTKFAENQVLKRYLKSKKLPFHNDSFQNTKIKSSQKNDILTRLNKHG